MNKTVIFDLDGTLALIDKRRALAAKDNGKINWKIFFDPTNISLDEPNIPVIEMAKTLTQKLLIHKIPKNSQPEYHAWVGIIRG